MAKSEAMNTAIITENTTEGNEHSACREAIQRLRYQQESMFSRIQLLCMPQLPHSGTFGTFSANVTSVSVVVNPARGILMSSMPMSSSVITVTSNYSQALTVTSSATVRNSVAKSREATSFATPAPLVLPRLNIASGSVKVDRLRPVASLLSDIGLSLVNEQSCAIECRKPSTSFNKHSASISAFSLKCCRCRCGFISESENVMLLHRECGDITMSGYTCCMCDYNTANSKIFASHLQRCQGIQARIAIRKPTLLCLGCGVEQRSQEAYQLHKKICHKKDEASLAPLAPQDCDIPIYMNSTNQQLLTVPMTSSQWSGGLGQHALPVHSAAFRPLSPYYRLFLGSSSGSSVRPTVSIRPATSNSTAFVLPMSVRFLSAGSIPQCFLNLSLPRSANVAEKLTGNPVDVTKLTTENGPRVSFIICPLCHAFVRDHAHLLIHYKVVHGKECVIEHTADQNEKKRVLAESQNNVGDVLACSRCNCMFDSTASLRKHFHDEHYADKDRCPLCNEEVAAGAPYELHMCTEHLRKCTIALKRIKLGFGD